MKEYKNKQFDLKLCDNMELMAQYPDNYFDLAVVDPPYGIDRNGMNMGNSVFNKDSKVWDKEIPHQDYFDELQRVSVNRIIWGGNYFNLPPSQYFAIWDKGETMYGRDFAECEFAWVYKGGTRIFKKSPNQKDRIHPTQKPVALYKWIFTNYAKQGYKILDTHLGSMSIAVAVDSLNKVEKMDLHLTGCEIDQEYFDKGIERLKRAEAQLSLF
jgi:site-specific DNA-methyltransferase (adenine-specific)